MPYVVNRCLENWRTMAPDHQVILVTPAAIRLHVRAPLPENFASLAPQGQADWVRLNLLHEHGGIWLDASVILFRNLDWVHRAVAEQEKEGMLYYLDLNTYDKRYPVYENWFIASTPRSTFVHRWLEEFNHIVRVHGNSGLRYVAALNRQRASDGIFSIQNF